MPRSHYSGSRKTKQPNRWRTSSLRNQQRGKDFLDYKELDLVMAAALKRCYDKHTHFRKKISVEEQRAQKDNRFLRGRQIAYLVYEYFRPTGSYYEIQGLSGLFSIKLENDDIQDFEKRWEQALLLTSVPPKDNVLEGSVRLQAGRLLPDSRQLWHHTNKKFFEEVAKDIITD